MAFMVNTLIQNDLRAFLHNQKKGIAEEKEIQGVSKV
jgi:hypothetical protein